jgi:hypothetical protein
MAGFDAFCSKAASPLSADTVEKLARQKIHASLNQD